MKKQNRTHRWQGIVVLSVFALALVGLALAVAPAGACGNPDLNGDGIVNLADVGLFAADYNSGQYHNRSDMDCDGDLDLADVALFAQAL